MARMQMLENKLKALVLSFYHLCPGDEKQASGSGAPVPDELLTGINVS